MEIETCKKTNVQHVVPRVVTITQHNNLTRNRLKKARCKKVQDIAKNKKRSIGSPENNIRHKRYEAKNLKELKNSLNFHSFCLTLFSCLAVLFHTIVLVIHFFNWSFVPEIVLTFLSAFCLASYGCTFYLFIVWVFLAWFIHKSL